MSTVALDTSCIVAAVCSWHERHAVVAAEIERRLDEGARMTIPAHALVEAYAVLTRLPAPHRLAPADAWALVKANFVDGVRVVALPAAAHARLLARLAVAGTAGGRTYDALIAEQVGRAGTDVLLTLNSRHFEPPPAGVTIVEPR
ncbi:MAG: PIN domain-containing protein [Vicinamibacteraceae bacterium]|nr:PIN domain-containing protein [Vicinamibacteraceae bacterium]